MAEEGKDSSELKFGKWVTWVNMAVMLLTAVISILPDGSPWALAAGAALAAANSVVSGSYSKSRGFVKASKAAAAAPLDKAPPA